MTALLAVSCTQTSYTANYPQQPGQNRYVALPGRAAVAAYPQDTDAAFNGYVNAHAPAAPQQSAVVPGVPQAPVMPVAPQDPMMPTAPQDPMMPTAPNPLFAAQNTGMPANPYMQGGMTTQASVPANGQYCVQITNGTSGRIFIEAQDDGGQIFPCGPMMPNQSYTTTPEGGTPLTGNITVVVRDPDQAGAPELRRYKVTPPANYFGKIVGITVLPGGQYRVLLDNKEYYTSPAPQKPAAAEKPAEKPADPAPAAPAATPAPAPAQPAAN